MVRPTLLQSALEKVRWSAACLLLAGCGSRTSLEGFFAAPGAGGGTGGRSGSAGGAYGAGGAFGSGGVIGAGGGPTIGCPPGSIDDDDNPATACVPCPHGTYSSSQAGLVCYPWRDCSWEFPEVEPPSSANDRVCVGPQPFRQFGAYGADEAYDVAVDAVGNVYVTGTTQGALDGPASGSVDAFVRKYSPKGALLWGFQYDGGGFDSAFRIRVDAVGSVHVMVARDNETAILWLDPTGVLISHQVLHGSYVDLAVVAYDLRYVARSFFLSDGTSDLELSRLHADGSAVWTVIANGGTSDVPGALTVATNGDVIVVGTTNGGLFRPGSGHAEGFVGRFSFDGNLVWGDQFVAAGDRTEPRSVALDSQENLYIAGNTAVDVQSPSDGFVTRVDASGVTEWTVVHGTTAEDSYDDIAVDAFDQVSVAGRTWGIFGQASAGLDDAFVARVLPYGYLGVVQQFGTDFSDYARGIAASPDGAWFVAGTTEGSLDGGANDAWTDAFVLRVPPF